MPEMERKIREFRGDLISGLDQMVDKVLQEHSIGLGGQYERSSSEPQSVETNSSRKES